MKRTVIILMAGVVLAGCTGPMFRFAPSEEQKTAADLAVSDTVALEPHVDEAGKPIHNELERLVRGTQTYFGPPKIRLTPANPANVPVIEKAEQDAVERPTLPEVADGTLDQIWDTIDRFMPLATLLLGGTALVYRQKGKKIYDALKETVKGYEKAKPDMAEADKVVLGNALSDTQSTTTKKAIAVIRVE